MSIHFIFRAGTPRWLQVIIPPIDLQALSDIRKLISFHHLTLPLPQVTKELFWLAPLPTQLSNDTLSLPTSGSSNPLSNHHCTLADGHTASLQSLRSSLPLHPSCSPSFRIIASLSRHWYTIGEMMRSFTVPGEFGIGGTTCIAQS